MVFSLTRLLFTLYLIIPVYHVLDSRYHVPTEERSETSLEFEPNLPLSTLGLTDGKIIHDQVIK